MFRSKNIYDTKRLTDLNVQSYVLSRNLNYDKIKVDKVKQLAIKPFLQKDFGKDKDCSLTSILTAIYYWDRLKDPLQLYIEIEKNAKKYFYEGNKIGTIPLFIKNIYQETMENFRIESSKIFADYIKNIGFSINTIKSLIDRNCPVILSFYDDGRNFYLNHTVTVIGYIDFKLFNSKGEEKIKPMLIIYDNWYATVSYLDLDLISIISSICY